MKSVDINEKLLKSNPKRYLLVKENSYTKDIIRLQVDEDHINKDGRMSLTTIDSVTSKYYSREQLLKDYDMYDEYDKESNGLVYIEYNSNGELRKLPVMYNDNLLNLIASNSTSKLWDSNKTRSLFTKMSFQWLKNDDGILQRLLNGPSPVSEPHLRNVIGYGLSHGTHTMNLEFIKKKMFNSYKQWRAFYYNSDVGYQKVKK